jgi:hypothetical protein
LAIVTDRALLVNWDGILWAITGAAQLLSPVQANTSSFPSPDTFTMSNLLQNPGFYWDYAGVMNSVKPSVRAEWLEFTFDAVEDYEISTCEDLKVR